MVRVGMVQGRVRFSRSAGPGVCTGVQRGQHLFPQREQRSSGQRSFRPHWTTAPASDQQVSLTWNPTSNATSYNVKRSTTHGGPYTPIASPTITSDTDASLTDGTTYYNVVSAVNATGQSANSSEVSATPTGATTGPPTPTGVSATAGNQQVVLNWNASPGATIYPVKRGTENGRSVYPSGHADRNH